MKKSTIKDIFYGTRGAMETMKMPQNRKKLTTLSDAYDELRKKLNPELAELHQKFSDAVEENFSEEVDFFFVEGFKLGLLIGIECME